MLGEFREKKRLRWWVLPLVAFVGLTIGYCYGKMVDASVQYAWTEN